MQTSLFIKINYLVPFCVVKKLPEHDSYLCNILNTQLFAQLPVKYAAKEYKVGDSGFAAVFEIKNAKIILSQKSPAYIRKIIEYLFCEPLRNYNLQIKKVAIFMDMIKILVKTDKVISNKELNEIFSPYFNNTDIKHYFPQGRFLFVKFHEEIELLIRSLLFYEDRIEKVVYFQSLAQATVYCDNGSVGLLVGEKGKNLVTAKKILQNLIGNIDIEIKSFKQEVI